jgi:hypothetical protein
MAASASPFSTMHGTRPQLIAISDKGRNEQFENKYGFPLTAKFRHVPDSFARLIAKTGYCNVLCSLDPGDFRPVCVPYILGHATNMSYIVGSSFEIPEPDANLGYVLETAGFISNGKMMLIAEVRLYANNQTPKYHVVIGDVMGVPNISAVLRKMGDVELFVDLASANTPIDNPSRQHPWMPQTWPLPFWATANS